MLLTEQGAKLIDFGICAVSGDNDTAHDGRIMGTTAYLAPERLDGQPVEPAVDVYALGVLMYLLLAGELPWEQSSGSNQDIHLVRNRPAPAVLLVPGLPTGIDRLCLRCLEERPWLRPTAQQIAEILRAFPVPGKEMWKPLLAQTGPSAPTPPTFTGPTKVKRLRRQHRTLPPRRGKTAAVTAAAAGVAVITWAVTGWAPASDTPQAATPAIAAPEAPAAIGCDVTFQVTDDGDGSFTAGIAITNLDDQPIEPGWRLRFHLPAGWQPDTSAATWHQDGSTITSEPRPEPLAPGQSVNLSITGSHAAGTPGGFTIDGLHCAATVSTSTTRITVVNLPGSTGSSPVDEPVGQQQPATGNGKNDDQGNDRGKGRPNPPGKR